MPKKGARMENVAKGAIVCSAHSGAVDAMTCCSPLSDSVNVTPVYR
jgi:hypothetical protein